MANINKKYDLNYLQSLTRSKLALAVGVASSMLLSIDATAAGRALEEVIVTANKKDQSIAEIAGTVNAVTSEQLDKFKVFQFEDIQALEPGLDLSKATERSFSVTLRGAPYDPDSVAAPTVTTYWNGVAVRPPIAFQQLFDIERIEVLRGAQGTLQGETSPSGAINIHTTQANVLNPNGLLRQTFVDDGGSVSEFAAGMPLIEGKLGVRVAGVYTEDENPAKSIFTGQTGLSRKKGGRVNFYALPTDDLDVSLTYEYQESKDDLVIGVEGASRLNNGNPPLKADQHKSLQEDNSNFLRRHELVGLTTNYEILDHTLTFVGGYERSSELPAQDGDAGNIFPNQAVRSSFASHLERQSYELRFANSDPTFWEYVAGAYYNKIDARAPHLYFEQVGAFTYDPASGNPPVVGWPGLGSPDFLYLKGDVRNFIQTESLAAFLNNDFYLTDDLTLTVGGRWQKYKQSRVVDVVNTADYNVGAFVLPPGTLLQSLPDEFKKTSEVARTGILKLAYKFTPELMVYGSYARSYRPGGAAIVGQVGIDPNLVIYKSETSNNFEVGFKQFPGDGRYQLTGALYYQAFKNFIQRSNGALIDLNGDGTLDTATQGFNINNDAIVRGAELEGTALLTSNWDLTLSLSYTESKYDKGSVPCGQLGDAADPGSQIRSCKTDGRLGAMPLFNATVSTQYTFPELLFGADGYVRTLFTYTGARIDDHAAFNTQIYDKYSLPAYGVWDLYLGLRSSEAWDISIWAKNLADKSAKRSIGPEYAASGFNATTFASETLLSGYSRVAMIPERSVGVTASWKFGAN